jgi:hypothetical protein
MKDKVISAEEFDKIFDEGEEDILQYFDVSNARRPGLEQRKISVLLPDWMIRSLDDEAERLGITRQAIVKIWLDEKMQSISA